METLAPALRLAGLCFAWFPCVTLHNDIEKWYFIYLDNPRSNFEYQTFERLSDLLWYFATFRWALLPPCNFNDLLDITISNRSLFLGAPVAAVTTLTSWVLSGQASEMSVHLHQWCHKLETSANVCFMGGPLAKALCTAYLLPTYCS